MMSMFGVLILLLLVLSVGVGIAVAIGIYVYRDAKRRGMNPVLWALVASLAPSLIGFIIYLIVRGNYSDLECPKCQTLVKEEYTRCPKCGAKLSPSCPNCAFPIEPDWKVCPKCANVLPEPSPDVVVPVKRKDKALGKILAVVILLPILLIALIVGMTAFPEQGVYDGSGGTCVDYVEAAQYLKELDNAELTDWYNNCKDGSAVHVMKDESFAATGNEKKVRYLVFMPGLEDPYTVQFWHNEGIFQKSLTVDYSTFSFDDVESVASLILITCTGDDTDLELEFYCEGEEIDCVFADCGFSIKLTDNAENIGEVKYSGGEVHEERNITSYLEEDK